MARKKSKVSRRDRSRQNNTEVVGTFNQRALEIIRETDAVSPDISPFLDSFMNDLTNLGPLPEIDLTTQQSAEAALEMLNRTQEQIQAHLKTAQALKRVLTSS